MSCPVLALALSLLGPSAAPQDGWTALQQPAVCLPGAAPARPLERLLRGYHILLEDVPQERLPRPAPAALDASAVSALLADESAREEGELRLFGEAPPLVVRGAKADLERARASLADLDALGNALEIELAAWWLPQAEPLPAWPEEAAARARIGSALPLGKAAVRSGASVDLGVRRLRRFVASFEAEVASDSNVAEPRMGRVASGRTLHVRACRVEGGRAVAIEGLLDLALELPFTEFDPDCSDLGVLHEPHVAALQLAFAGKVRSGGWLALSIAGHGQHDGVLLLQASARPDPAAPVRWRGFDVASLAAPLLDWPAPEPENDGQLEEAPEPAQLRAPLLSAQLSSAAASLLGSARRGKLGSFSSSGAAGLVWGDGLVFVPVAETEALAGVDAIVRAAESERTRSHELALSHGALAVRMPACEGSFVRVLAVEERTALVDYDVEIAEEAWIPLPRVERVLSGLVVEGALQGGALVARGWRAEGRPHERLDKVRANLGALQLLDRDRLVLAGRVPAGGQRELVSADGVRPAVTLTLGSAR